MVIESRFSHVANNALSRKGVLVIGVITTVCEQRVTEAVAFALLVLPPIELLPCNILDELVLLVLFLRVVLVKAILTPSRPSGKNLRNNATNQNGKPCNY